MPETTTADAGDAPTPSPDGTRGFRWGVPIVGALVAIALVAVIVSSLGEDDERSADQSSTTAGGAVPASVAPSDLAAVEAVCAARRGSVANALGQTGRLSQQAAAATSPEQLSQVADQAELEGQELLTQVSQLRDEVAAADVPPAAVANRDAIAAVLDEVIFTLAAFTSRSVEVLRSGDPAVIAAYADEVEGAIAGLQEILGRLTEATGGGAPSCTVDIAL